jgi:hypothetical protein
VWCLFDVCAVDPHGRIAGIAKKEFVQPPIGQHRSITCQRRQIAMSEAIAPAPFEHPTECFHLNFLSRLAGLRKNKKADVAEHPQGFHHVGLLSDGPPAMPGCPSISHPITTIKSFNRVKLALVRLRLLLSSYGANSGIQVTCRLYVTTEDRCAPHAEFVREPFQSTMRRGNGNMIH